ncbi:MAG: DUF4234 domain-containing protein [Clostridia bacterium]|nr:DUF4234 domain-containing protein [Clostridia bacterium]
MGASSFYYFRRKRIMQFCTNCGSKIADGTAVCSSCGQPVVNYSRAAESGSKPENAGNWGGSAQAQSAAGAASPSANGANGANGTNQQGPESNTQSANGGYQQASNGYTHHTNYSYQQPGGHPYANYSYQNSPNGGAGMPPPNAGGIVPRSLAVAIILTIVTCGIYQLYWLYKLDEESAQLAGEEPRGAMIILLGLVTCGIYFLIWYYQMGSDRMRRLTGKDNGLLYILLGLFGLGIVTAALVQSDLNNMLGGSPL